MSDLLWLSSNARNAVKGSFRIWLWVSDAESFLRLRGFLHGTDVGSTTAVMAMYLAGLKRAYWISSLVRWGQSNWFSRFSNISCVWDRHRNFLGQSPSYQTCRCSDALSDAELAFPECWHDCLAAATVRCDCHHVPANKCCLGDFSHLCGNTGHSQTSGGLKHRSSKGVAADLIQWRDSWDAFYRFRGFAKHA